MKFDRNEMLAEFVKCEALKERTELNADQLKDVDFSNNSDDLLIESLKSLLISFCNDDSDTLILRQVNLRIDKMSKREG